jgi:two-component system cell cycle sensor histidine kinase/response regulator CckA
MGDGSRLVLLVDDEPMIRGLIRSALRSLDCTVVEAGSGTEAAALFKQHGTRIALLLTDIVMPGMKGDELATLLTTLRPELPVLFISGTTKHLPPSLQHFECLAKPFHPEVLTRKIAKILSSVGNTGLVPKANGKMLKKANL